LGKVRGLFGVKGTTNEWKLAVAEPLFENLVAAKRVIPDVDGDS
jgi:hypothetical protein